MMKACRDVTQTPAGASLAARHSLRDELRYSPWHRRDSWSYPFSCSGSFSWACSSSSSCSSTTGRPLQPPSGARLAGLPHNVSGASAARRRAVPRLTITIPHQATLYRLSEPGRARNLNPSSRPQHGGERPFPTSSTSYGPTGRAVPMPDSPTTDPQRKDRRLTVRQRETMDLDVDEVAGLGVRVSLGGRVSPSASLRLTREPRSAESV